jgi:hypothetical protein
MAIERRRRRVRSPFVSTASAGAPSEPWSVAGPTSVAASGSSAIGERRYQQVRAESRINRNGGSL